MKSYVTLRGSRSSRHITRDASPLTRAKIMPYAALVIAHPDGTSTRFELTYCSLDNGRTVRVYLHRAHTQEKESLVYTDGVSVSTR